MRAKAKNKEEQVGKQELQKLEAIKAHIGNMDNASPPGQKIPEEPQEDEVGTSRGKSRGQGGT